MLARRAKHATARCQQSSTAQPMRLREWRRPAQRFGIGTQRQTGYFFGR